MASIAPATSRNSHLLLAVGAIVLATVVVPPVAAWRLSVHRKLDRTRESAVKAADRLRKDGARLDALSLGITVACGPGSLPELQPNGQPDTWSRDVVTAPEVFGPGMPTDSWGRCFLMNIGDWPRGGRVWILSAGPNGVVDTPLGASTLGGDDIGAIIR